MATGRDAADVAITTTFGQSWLKSFKVISYEIENTGAAETMAEPAVEPTALLHEVAP
jgi:hypothetical protein